MRAEEVADTGIVFDHVQVGLNTPSSFRMEQQQVGRATVDKVFEIDGLTMPFAVMFPSVSDADIRAAASWLGDPNVGSTADESRTNFSWHTYVVRFGEFVVLVDTGHGNDKDRPDFIPQGVIDTNFLQTLREAGVEPHDVTHVLCTHIHYDHVGWNTYRSDGKWKLSFPHARHLFPRTDYAELASNHEADETNGAAFRQSVLPVADRGLVNLFDDRDVLIDSSEARLWVETAPGHSPDNSIFHLESEGAHAIFSGDVIHHQIQLLRDDIVLAFEYDVDRTIAARRKLLDAVADTEITLFPAHFGGTSGGHIVSDPDNGGYRWKPLPSESAG
jgi:glyoxylase-like metal-dependent hydrolase (beta-lactamase superfamily II)